MSVLIQSRCWMTAAPPEEKKAVFRKVTGNYFSLNFSFLSSIKKNVKIYTLCVS